jgi:hypothetical protein
MEGKKPVWEHINGMSAGAKKVSPLYPAPATFFLRESKMNLLEVTYQQKLYFTRHGFVHVMRFAGSRLATTLPAARRPCKDGTLRIVIANAVKQSGQTYLLDCFVPRHDGRGGLIRLPDAQSRPFAGSRRATILPAARTIAMKKGNVQNRSARSMASEKATLRRLHIKNEFIKGIIKKRRLL